MKLETNEKWALGIAIAGLGGYWWLWKSKRRDYSGTYESDRSQLVAANTRLRNAMARTNPPAPAALIANLQAEVARWRASLANRGDYDPEGFRRTDSAGIAQNFWDWQGHKDTWLGDIPAEQWGWGTGDIPAQKWGWGPTGGLGYGDNTPGEAAYFTAEGQVVPGVPLGNVVWQQYL